MKLTMKTQFWTRPHQESAERIMWMMLLYNSLTLACLIFGWYVAAIVFTSICYVNMLIMLFSYQRWNTERLLQEREQQQHNEVPDDQHT